MNLRKKIRIVAFAAMALSFAIAYAQDQKEDPRAVNPVAPLPPQNSTQKKGTGGRPLPAARGVSTYDAQPYDPAQVEPDTNTLSGALGFGVGSLQHSHNIFDPSLSASFLGQSAGISGQSGLHATVLIGGGLNLDRIWSRYHFTTAYSGGENFNFGYQPDAQFHDVVVSQNIEWQRWRLTLRDDFAVSRGSAFGGSGFGGPGMIGQFSSTVANSLNSIGDRFQPSETIQTGQAMRYRNTVLGEAEYSFSRRSAVTVSGSYGLLHFPDAGYISSHMVTGQAGFDYLLDPKNSIAVLASYGKIDYTGRASSTADYLAELAYGRKITGRLAFEVAAGPDQIRSTSGPNGNFTLLTWAVNSALTYQLRRTGVSLAFVRGLSGGSGVFFGAKSDTFSGSLHHQFTRFWTASLNGGYGFNRSLALAGQPTSSFDSWFVGANAGRQVGRHAQVGFNYGLLKQDKPSFCPVPDCGVGGFQQTFGITVNWHLRPIE